MTRAGPIELRARADLRQIAEDYRRSAVALAYLEAARLLDAGVPNREFAAISREMRLCLVQLRDMGGVSVPDNEVDRQRRKREDRDRRYAEEAEQDG